MKSSRFLPGWRLACLTSPCCAVGLGRTMQLQGKSSQGKGGSQRAVEGRRLGAVQPEAGPWYGRTLISFIQDCSKKTMAAHPIKPEMIGQDLSSVKDAKTGKSIYPDSDAYCKSVQASPSGTWNEYWWPKPGEKEPARKITINLSAKGTPYIVNAGSTTTRRRSRNCQS